MHSCMHEIVNLIACTNEYVNQIKGEEELLLIMH